MNEDSINYSPNEKEKIDEFIKTMLTDIVKAVISEPIPFAEQQPNFFEECIKNNVPKDAAIQYYPLHDKIGYGSVVLKDAGIVTLFYGRMVSVCGSN